MPSRYPKLLLAVGPLLLVTTSIAVGSNEEGHSAGKPSQAEPSRARGVAPPNSANSHPVNGEASDLPDAPSLLREAERRLAGYPTISAKIRQRIEMFGQKMAGSGSYQQLRTSRRPKWRLELSMQAGDSDIRLERMCDGQTLWMVRQFDETQSQQRIDLERVRERLGKESAKLMGMLEFSALSETVAKLSDNFQFGKVEPVLVSSVEMWRLKGVWKQQDNGGTGQIPTGVEILLGRDDKIPYRVEFFQNTTDGPTKFVVTELYDVGLGIAIEPGRFRPSADDFIDGTEQFIDDRRAQLKRQDPGNVRR